MTKCYFLLTSGKWNLSVFVNAMSSIKLSPNSPKVRWKEIWLFRGKKTKKDNTFVTVNSEFSMSQYILFIQYICNLRDLRLSNSCSTLLLSTWGESFINYPGNISFFISFKNWKFWHPWGAEVITHFKIETSLISLDLNLKPLRATHHI